MKYFKQYNYATVGEYSTLTLCPQQHPDDVVLTPRGKQSHMSEHSVYSILRHVINRCLPKRVPFPGNLLFYFLANQLDFFLNLHSEISYPTPFSETVQRDDTNFGPFLFYSVAK